ncbi:beta family protein [Streptomyces sp. NPDC020917]|uniref:beta family protein n=1 Tax=Streptomyces sp. NPDC020917 TaxID=3365102 RepID=UPI00378D9058
MAYVPILKGKLGEFLALGEMAPDVRRQVLPVLEVVVGDSRVRDVLETFREHAWRQLPTGLSVAVDCGALWESGPVGGVWTGHSLNWLSEAFGAWLLPLIPVFRPGDPPGSLLEVRGVQRAHGQGALLRLDMRSWAGAPGTERSVRAALKRVRLPPEEVDLVLDAGFVSGDTAVTNALPVMLNALNWARTAPWRSITAASGAFRRSVADLSREHPNLLHRWDASLWRKIAGSTDDRPPEFGDYGVSHPVAPRRAGRATIPHLRYTLPDDWVVYVADRQASGNDDFFRISRALVRSDDWPDRGASMSWGDAQIALCAWQQRPKAGTATHWRAWATSHHLAAVTESLRAFGRP